MKKLILILGFFFLISSDHFAQILNAGFENWTDSDPDDWATIDIPGFVDAVSQSTDSHSGSWAMKLEVLDFGGNPYLPLVNSGESSEGFAISERYGSLTGFYKLFPVNDDIIVLNLVMYKNSDAIGGGFLFISSASSSYTQFNVPIFYSLPDIPDTAFISIIISDSSSGNINIGTSAIIDDLAFGGPTDVEPVDQIPSAYSLKQNYPNPFNPSTTIEFSIPEESFVELKVYNILGKEVATLAYNTYSSGSYKVDFNGEDLSSGIYIAKINATAKEGNFNFSKSLKMTLIK